MRGGVPIQPLNRTLDRALPALPLRSRAVKRRLTARYVREEIPAKLIAIRGI
jgi:hypothetical protein